MTDLLSDAEKQTFQRAAARRRDNGVRLKLLRMFVEESQAVAFNEVWESWLLRWGKVGAMDRLIRLMCTVEARVRDQENADNRKRS
jgi:hypothetical protein